MIRVTAAGPALGRDGVDSEVTDCGSLAIRLARARGRSPTRQLNTIGGPGPAGPAA